MPAVAYLCQYEVMPGHLFIFAAAPAGVAGAGLCHKS